MGFILGSESGKSSHSMPRLTESITLPMLNSKSILLLMIVTIISWPVFSQQARLIDSLNKRNEKPLKLVLNDADHDGISDQLDKEPNTPAGCPVDMHGITLDTDEDGVPDCKDKEKLTQQKCFPVDSNGVGVCRKAKAYVGKTNDFSIAQTRFRFAAQTCRVVLIIKLSFHNKWLIRVSNEI